MDIRNATNEELMARDGALRAELATVRGPRATEIHEELGRICEELTDR